MKVAFEKPDSTPERWIDWHIFTVADEGFTRLDIYGRLQRGIEIDVLRQFAQQVNRLDLVDTLHPTAPISAIPNRFFRDQADSQDPLVMVEFKSNLLEFLRLNQEAIRAERILFDFHVCSAQVPRHYIEAIDEILGLGGHDEVIQEIVVFR